uniref:Transposase n=1 Tax=Panagrellus redivivus TaxID=6233 RepID=A0A7E4ZQU5_PANRE
MSPKLSGNGAAKAVKTLQGEGNMDNYRVLKQVHTDNGFFSKVMSIITSFVNGVFQRIAKETSRIVKYNERTLVQPQVIDQTTNPLGLKYQ